MEPNVITEQGVVGIPTQNTLPANVSNKPEDSIILFTRKIFVYCVAVSLLLDIFFVIVTYLFFILPVIIFGFVIAFLLTYFMYYLVEIKFLSQVYANYYVTLTSFKRRAFMILTVLRCFYYTFLIPWTLVMYWLTLLRPSATFEDLDVFLLLVCFAVVYAASLLSNHILFVSKYAFPYWLCIWAILPFAYYYGIVHGLYRQLGTKEYKSHFVSGYHPKTNMYLKYWNGDTIPILKKNEVTVHFRPALDHVSLTNDVSKIEIRFDQKSSRFYWGGDGMFEVYNNWKLVTSHDMFDPFDVSLTFDAIGSVSGGDTLTLIPKKGSVGYYSTYYYDLNGKRIEYTLTLPKVDQTK